MDAYLHRRTQASTAALSGQMALAALIVADAGITGVLSQLRNATALVVTGGALLSAVVLIQPPWLSALLQLRPLDGDDWLIAGLGGVLVCFPILYERLVTAHRINK